MPDDLCLRPIKSAALTLARNVLRQIPEALLEGTIKSGLSSPAGPEAAISLGIFAFGKSLTKAVRF